MNIYAKILIGLNVFVVIGLPFIFGKKREPFGPKEWLMQVIGFGLLLKALEVF